MEHHQPRAPHPARPATDRPTASTSIRWRSARTGAPLPPGSADDGKVWLWNITDPAHPTLLGQPLTGPRLCRLFGGVQPGRAHPCRQQRDDKVWLWNITDPAHPTPLGQPLTGPGDAVSSVAFSPDGHTLAAGSNDQIVWSWNLDITQVIAENPCYYQR